VDTHYHFLREFIEDDFIKIEFLRSAENDSDLFTKNINQKLYAKHTKKILEHSEVHSTGWSLVMSFAINHLVLHAWVLSIRDKWVKWIKSKLVSNNLSNHNFFTQLYEKSFSLLSSNFFLFLITLDYFNKFEIWKTIFDDQATNLVMVNTCSWVGSLCNSSHEWKKITILVKVSMIEIIWIMLHSIFDKIGIQDPTLGIIRYKIQY
jgi:hypothetical protein